MRTMNIKIEKLPIQDDCDNDGILKETELSQLSFWNEPQQNFLPEWGHFHNRIGYFKVAGVVFGLILSFLSGYFIFRLFNTQPTSTPVQENIKVLQAPILPHKVYVKQTKEVEDHAVYRRHEAVTEPAKILDEEEDTDLVALHEEDLPYEAPIKKSKPKAVPVATIKKTAPCVTEDSYYIEIGTFDSHQTALDHWCHLKKDQNKGRHLHEIDPLIEITNTDRGEQYRLLAGPVPYKEGRFKTQILNSKGHHMKLVGRNN